MWNSTGPEILRGVLGPLALALWFAGLVGCGRPVQVPTKAPQADRAADSGRNARRDPIDASTSTPQLAPGSTADPGRGQDQAADGSAAAVPRAGASPSRPRLRLQPIGGYRHGGFDVSAAEIVAYDPATHRLFVTNSEKLAVDVLDLADPTAPTFVRAIDIRPYGGGVPSVSVKGGLLAVAVPADPPQRPGNVVFFNTQGEFLSAVSVGPMPDMVCFTPDGKAVLTANEGGPDDEYRRDPEGSVSLIDLSAGAPGLVPPNVVSLDFRTFSDRSELDASIRVFGPGATVAQDLEPEYVAVAGDSRTAWVTLQENNALAAVDLQARRITRLIGLGFKDYARLGVGLDASDRDGRINIRAWPVKGMYQPDSIAAYEVGGATYLVTANEGYFRDYPGYNEVVRVADVQLDPGAFPNAADLKAKAMLGRLKTSVAMGDSDGDGDHDEIYTFGGRGFSIWSADGELVFDSGDQFERITARTIPEGFNSNNDENDTFDRRSDDKGPEAEGLAIGQVGERVYAFIGIERVGGVMVFDVTEPARATFESYVNTRDFRGDPEEGSAGDLAPEGVLFIAARDSPIHAPLLVVAFEVSGTTRIFKVVRADGESETRQSNGRP